MILTSLIFNILFVIFLTLFVFFYFKETKHSAMLVMVFLPLSFLSILGIYIPIMVQKLPDSLHLTSYSVMAMLSAYVGLFLYLFNKTGICKILKHFFFLGCEVLWCITFGSVFYVYHISSAVRVIAPIIYIGLFLAFCIISGKHKLIFYMFIAVHCLMLSILTFICIVSFCNEPGWYSVCCLLGSLMYSAMILIYSYSKLKKIISSHFLIEMILLLFSQICFGASCALMQTLY